MEIERKFLVAAIPAGLESFPSSKIEQGYLSTEPVLRIRQKDTRYIFTYKSAGLMSREEIEVPLTQSAYIHLIPKCDGNLISKIRYRIPEEHGYTIEFDVFQGCYQGLLIAEIEFPSEEEALSFQPPTWLGCEVTKEASFHNSTLSSADPKEILQLAAKRLKEKKN